MSNERWLPVPGWEGLYSVSDMGRVRSEPRRVRSGQPEGRMTKLRILRPARKASGHLSVCLYRAGKSSRHHVHRMVLLAFAGPPPTSLHEAAHNDGTPAHNQLCNLRWATRSENLGDKVQHGTHNRGEAHPLCKLTDEQVRAIRREPGRCKDIAPRYSVTFQTIWAIKAGKTRTTA